MSMLSEALLKELRGLVQVNDHGGACQCAAVALGCNNLAERFGSINRRQMELGHLPHNLYEERQGLRQQLMAAAQEKLNPAEYMRFSASI